MHVVSLNSTKPPWSTLLIKSFLTIPSCEEEGGGEGSEGEDCGLGALNATNKQNPYI
jgi:hypothetical protein